MTMNEWANELPILQNPYQGPLTPTKHLAVLERALGQFQFVAEDFQSLADALTTCIAAVRREMTRTDEAAAS
jgi:hypothetical protein